MSERPILFSTPMVQAILAERKTQTRRVIKQEFIQSEQGPIQVASGRFHFWCYGETNCPYGKPGDILWVRETWCKLSELDGNDQVIDGTEKIYYAADNPDFPFNYFLRDDGTWHRPLTTLELAALQGLPIRINGKPLILSGNSDQRWREAIGNMVPPPAAGAIAEVVLQALLVASENAWDMNANDIWVSPKTWEEIRTTLDA